MCFAAFGSELVVSLFSSGEQHTFPFDFRSFTICSSVNWEDSQTQALSFLPLLTISSLHQFRTAKPFIRCRNEWKGYFRSIICRAIYHANRPVKVHPFSHGYLVINSELPFSQSLRALCKGEPGLQTVSNYV